MKTIKLLNLKLTNFKGIKEFELAADGQDINAFGDNGTGKTTLFDAFVWVLFDKDSLNNSTGKFDLKTLRNGKAVSKLNHEVEVTLLVDDKELTLKKVYKEKWTKQRGSNVESFSGHTTDYYIDDVPSKKKEFDETIKEIVQENVFKLLTNPSHFNDDKVLHWRERRQLLLEIAGDITDEDVIATNKSLSKLLDALNGKSIDDHKKIIAAKRKEINKRIDELPTRVDEISRNMPDLAGLDESSIKGQVDKLTIEMEQKQEQINSIRNGSEVNELKKQVSDIDLQIANVRNEHTQNEQQELFKLQAKLQEEKSNHTILQGDVKAQMQQKAMNDGRIKDIENQLADLREDYKFSQEQYQQQLEQEFEHDDNCICPTCEQDLPQDKVDEAVAKFNKNKSDLLEKIQKRIDELNKKGPELGARKSEIEQDNETVQAEIEKITEQGTKKKNDIEKLVKKIKESELNVTPIEENQKYKQLQDEKATLQNKILELEQSQIGSINIVESEIKALKEEQQKLQIDLSKIAQSEQSAKRITELEAEEKKLAAEYEELEQQLYLTEEFTRTKVNLLTEKINSKFKYARFKLFDEQINGGLTETCVTTYEGVPYDSNLNSASKLNIGLDIINTLSKHYGVQAPIFIDNAESVTKLIDIDAQIIRLVVSEQDKQLRIETKSENQSEVA